MGQEKKEIKKTISAKYKKMEFCGTTKIQPALEGDDGFVYISAKGKDWQLKLAPSLADTMLTEKAEEGKGENIMELKHATIAQALKIIMKNEYHLKISQATKITQLLRSIYSNDESTENAIELANLLKEEYQIDEKEVEGVMQKLEISIVNDLNLATRLKWGKSRYDLDFDDIASVIEENVEKKEEVKEEIAQEERDRIMKQLPK
jgi:hypothetical protein